MSVLSSLLGVGRPQQLAGPMQTTAFPEELAPYYKDILSKSQALYEDRTKEGFQPYQGPTMAEFTPEQQQAFAGIAGLAGQQAPKFAEAEQLTRQAATAIGSEDIEQFMNPYQQAVVDIEKREAQKQFEQKTLPSIRAAQVAQGSFGGTRGSLLEAQTLEGQNRLLSDIQSRGSKQAYEQALQMAQAQKAREGQAGAQLATMTPQAFKAQLGELGAVQTVGEEKQRQAQTALNEAYKQFLDERQFPQQSLAQYQGVVQAQPASQMLESVQYAPPAPSSSQQLLGGLGTLVGTYGAFGGFSPGGVFGNKTAKTGGGIGGLPIVKRQFPGQIGYGKGSTGFSKDIDFLKPYLSSLGKYGTMAKNVYDRTLVDPLQYGIEKSKEYLKPGSGGIFSKADPQGSAKIRQIAGVTYPDPTREELEVGMSPADFDIRRLKEGVSEAYGESLDLTQAGVNKLIDLANAAKIPLSKYLNKNIQPSRKYDAGDFRVAGGLDRDDTINLRDLVNEKRDNIEKGYLPKLESDISKLIASGKSKIKDIKVPGITSSLDKKLNSATENANKLKTKLPTILEKAKESKDNIASKISKKDKEVSTGDAIVTDKNVIKQIKPNEANKLVNETIKKEGKKLEQLVKDVKNNPDDVKKKKTLSSTREAYLNLLQKQQNDLGKQQGNIDDSRRKSMFEFLAKVSSRYGKGENLSDAAAGELDGAMQRTRQLDQANLDLKNKQREAELNVAKETMGIEEKKAAAKIAADKAKLEDKRKSQELYIKYMKAQNEGANKLKMPTKNNIKQQKKLLKSYFNVDNVSDIRDNFGGDIPIGALGNVDANNATTALKTLFEDSRFQTDFYNEFANYKQTDADSGDAIKDIVKKLIGSGNYKFDTEKQTILFGKVPFGTKNVIKN